MRNKFPTICYLCNTICLCGEGHPERHKGVWRVIHATCSLERKEPPPEGLKWKLREDGKAILVKINEIS